MARYRAFASISESGVTELDCGQGIAQATLVATELGLGTCLLGVPAHKKLKRALALPEDSKVLVVQTVGYPAESMEAGGQRPRLPFEELYFLNRCGEAFPRDSAVVETLERERMLQAPAPLPWRRAELAYLAKALDIRPIFGEEITEIVQEMAAEMTDTTENSNPKR